MNSNEVISNRANEILGHKRGEKFPVHPNDHVNLGQSSNDTFPTAINVSICLDLKSKLYPALESLSKSLNKKTKKFKDFGFDTHVGYGTRKHLEAIKKHGYCELHRKNFEPIKSLVQQSPLSKVTPL